MSYFSLENCEINNLEIQGDSMNLFKSILLTVFILSINVLLKAEPKIDLYLSLGIGYIGTHTEEGDDMHKTSKFTLLNSFMPALILAKNQNHLKLDYKNFKKNWDDYTDEVNNELTGWHVKDISLKFGHTFAEKKHTTFSAYAGVGGLFWSNEYMKSISEQDKQVFYLTLPLEIELRQKFSDKLRGGISIYNDLNAKCQLWGAGVNLQVKIF